MSQATVLRAQIGSAGLWSISRGMARGFENRDDYNLKLSGADNDRLNDLDRRGVLSRKYLIDFTEWFLDVCFDQITFMSGLFELGSHRVRLNDYGQSIGLSDAARQLLNREFTAGEMPRGEASQVTEQSERAARTALKELSNEGLVRSETPNTPVLLVFPSRSVESLFPRLVR